VRRGLLVIIAASIVAACGGSSNDAAPAPTAAAPAKPRAAATPDAGTSIVSTVPYMYNPVAKRDPFRNLLDETHTGSGSENTNAPMCAEPLCGFDLDQLTLVAVVSGDANPVGMLEDPTKVGHLVHRNSRVGKQGGKVTQIQRDCVVVTEYFQTPDGKVNPNRVNICIKQDKRTVPVLDLLQNKIFEAQ
jgi:type IV pilus assembly protein PilP